MRERWSNTSVALHWLGAMLIIGLAAAACYAFVYRRRKLESMLDDYVLLLGALCAAGAFAAAIILILVTLPDFMDEVLGLPGRLVRTVTSLAGVVGLLALTFAVAIHTLTFAAITAARTRS